MQKENANLEEVKGVLNENAEEVIGGATTVYLVESFLKENYEFRRNLLSGKIEFAIIHATDKLDDEKEDEISDKPLAWNTFTKEDMNSIVRRAKMKKKGRGQGSVKKTKRCCKAAVNHEGRLAFPACRWYK